MKKVSKDAAYKGDWDVQTARNINKINEIVDWINEKEGERIEYGGGKEK